MPWKPVNLSFLGWAVMCLLPLRAQEQALFTREAIFHPVIGRSYMASTQQALATQSALAVLKEGGNAVDAAVTAGFTLAVTLPRAGNLGGGGFMLIHLAREGKTIAVDYREKAPKAATRDMFLDDEGDLDREKANHSYLSVGVPGTVAGLTYVLEKYGTISLKRALRDAIEYAEKGIPVDDEFALSLVAAKERFKASPAAAAIFLKADGEPLGPGETLVQKDLAWSLRQLRKHGRDAFYKGAIAKKLVADMEAHGGIVTMEDLAAYRPAIREPVHGSYRGYEVLTMPPPSSGGIHLVQMLNILEGYAIGELGFGRARTLHLMAEAMKRAYADRFKHLGDTDFVRVPVAGLISKAYAAALRAKIDTDKATPSSEIEPGDPGLYFESDDTTHFSIMDKAGNAVANTYTLNFSYGTKLVAAGTGILLNNEMSDFAAKPGVADSFGLIGGEKNAIEPEKRMLSSMTPTIVMKDGKPFLLTGSPGGSRIISSTLQILVNVIDHGMNIAEATNAPRIHHQWFPDELRVERGMNGDTRQLLEAMGHTVSQENAMGSTQSILFLDGIFYGASDPRRPGALTLGD